MESLVSIAKRLGIRPNPHMTQEEKEIIFKRIHQEVNRLFPADKPQANYKHVDLYDLKNRYYDLHKVVSRSINNSQQFSKNYDAYAQPLPGVRLEMQDGAFQWHDAREVSQHGHERFVADIQLDSPYFPEMIKKLDAFILKYKAGYKIPVRDKRGERSDTLNLYLPKEITPVMAKEFVQIVRPCLSEQYDAYLNGRPLMEKERPIKGIRIGPEYKRLSLDERIEPLRAMYKRVEKEASMSHSESVKLMKILVCPSSLGEKEATFSTLDLAYYLAGKEGQNPYQLMDYDGRPYRKSLSIDSAGLPVFQKIGQTSIQNQAFQKPPVRGHLDSLLKNLSSTQMELDKVRQEIAQLRRQKAALKK